MPMCQGKVCLIVQRKNFKCISQQFLPKIASACDFYDVALQNDAGGDGKQLIY